jgi:uncharacterized protein YndB with AHSA1/START domain
LRETIHGGAERHPLYRRSARHWTEEARRSHEEMGFADGWGACADQLKALCEAA